MRRAIISPQARDEFRQSWRVLAAGWMGLGLGQIAMGYTYGAFIAPLTTARHWSLSEISAITLFEGLGAVLLAPLMGMLLDEVGSRRVILFAVPLLAVAYGSAALVGQSVWTLYVVFFFVGAFGCVGMLVYTRVVTGFFSAGLGAALGIIYSGMALSSMFLPRVVQNIVDTHGWQVGWLSLAALVLISLPVIIAWLREPRLSGRSGVAGHSGVSLAEALCMSPLWLLAFANLLYGLALGGVVFDFFPFLSALGMSRAEAAIYIGTFGTLAFVGQLAIGFILDRFSAAYVCSVLAIAQASAIGVFGFTHSRLAVLAIPIMGFALGGYLSCFGYLTPRYFGLRSYGKISGLMSSTQIIGFGLSPYVFSTMSERFGSFSASFTLSVVLTLGAAMLFSLVGRYDYWGTDVPVNSTAPA